MAGSHTHTLSRHPVPQSGAVVQLVSSDCKPPSSEKNESHWRLSDRNCPPPSRRITSARLPPLCTGVLANWMLRKSPGPGFEVGDHKEDSEQGVRAGEDQVRRVHTSF